MSSKRNVTKDMGEKYPQTSVSHQHSTQSRRSAGSVASIGIGKQPKMKTLNREQSPNLVPENSSYDPNAKLFDVIVFLFYCPQHDMIAVTNIDRAKCVFLPFITMSENVCWDKLSHEGIKLIIGSQDAELDANIAKELTPEYNMFYLNVFRIQISNNHFITRITNCVILKQSAFKCCKAMTSKRVQWISTKDLLGHKIEKLWGPEVENFTRINNESLYVDNIFSSFTLKNLAFYYRKLGTWQRTMLVTTGLRHMEHLVQIFHDYLEHCYPAFYMSFESFRWFLHKKGFDAHSESMKHYFNAFSINGLDYLDFFEVLLGLIAIDPITKQTNEGRIRFVFRYYDMRRAEALTMQQVIRMAEDILKTENVALNDADIQSHTLRIAKSIGRNLELKDFIPAAKNKKITGLDKICQSAHPIISKMIQLQMDKKNKRQTKKKTQRLMFNRAATTNIGTCHRCRKQRYHYSIHAVNFDSVGRCVQPTMIDCETIEECAPEEMNPHKYSIEIVFGNDSFVVIIMDMIRDYHFRLQIPPTENRKRPYGLMADREDWGLFDKYLNLICECLLGILKMENKVLKINSPALVVGDIQGSLHDLLVLEKHYLLSVPAFPTNLVFLGNYSGVKGNGIECILYVFCLKIISPNKIFLLRGTHEMHRINLRFLESELFRKYGTMYGGKAFHNINKVFELLPFGAIVDETIFCAHSGIPRDAKLANLNKLPSEIPIPSRDAPSGYEIMMNIPANCNTQILKMDSDLKKFVTEGSPFASETPQGIDRLRLKMPYHAKVNRMDNLRKRSSSVKTLNSNPRQTPKERPHMNGMINQLNVSLPPPVFPKPHRKTLNAQIAPISVPLPPPINGSAHDDSQKRTSPNKSKGSSDLSNSVNNAVQLWQVGYEFSVSGFFPSMKHLNAYSFDASALRKFLEDNNFTHMIRSQYVPNTGFLVQFNESLISCFHCSNYLSAVGRHFSKQKIQEKSTSQTKEPENPCVVIFIDRFNSSINPIIMNNKGKLVLQPVQRLDCNKSTETETTETEPQETDQIVDKSDSLKNQETVEEIPVKEQSKSDKASPKDVSEDSSKRTKQRYYLEKSSESLNLKDFSVENSSKTISLKKGLRKKSETDESENETEEAKEKEKKSSKENSSESLKKSR